MQDKIVSQVARSIKEEDFEDALKKLHKGTYISRHSHSSLVPGIVQDIEWNHLDQRHRIYLHDAYHEALRIATGKDFAFSLTTFGKWPVYIKVFDARIARGLFYQTFSVFSLIFCQQFTHLTQVGDQVRIDINWITASHKWLRFLHGPFNRKLLKLQEKQDGEDFVVRDRRQKLRREGFNFKTNEPDFLNANVLTDMVIFPPLKEKPSFDVSTLVKNTRTRIRLGPVDLYATATDSAVHLWPALCPHEGADIPESNLCSEVASCPWHGRKFSAVKLAYGGTANYRMGNILISLENQNLILKENILSEDVKEPISL